MHTFLLIVAIIAPAVSIAAGLTFIVKKLRKRWIPSAVFVVWAGGGLAAFIANALLGNWVRAAMDVAIMACALGAWVLHDMTRQYI